MSSDLLAEFDSFYQSPKNATTTSKPKSNAPSHPFISDKFSFFEAPTLNKSIESTSTSQRIAPLPNADDTWGGLGSFNRPQDQTSATTAFDPWASLESLGKPSKPTPSVQQGVLGTGGSNGEPSSNLERPGITRASTLELFSSNIADLAEDSKQKSKNISDSGHPWEAHKAHNDILFDAADELGSEDEDDFGEFETVAASPPQETLQPTSLTIRKTATTPQELSFSSATLNAGLSSYPQAPKSPSFQERNPFAELSLTTTPVTAIHNDEKAAVESPITAWPTYEPAKPRVAPYNGSSVVEEVDDEEGWGDFADLPPETPAPVISRTEQGSNSLQPDLWAWDAADSAAASTEANATEVPPTNIPPPSVLLTLFPQLFNLPQSSLFKAVANQPFALKNRVLSDPSTIDFLRAYILLATVAARLIAGRKLRWKRDKHLSQAMKIGPAAAGGKGGMKLTGVDKAEAAREDREASEVVRIWKEQVGRLRSTVATANSSIHDHSKHLTVPEINEVMPLKTATVAEGALTAPKACVLCGLRRDERIIKVDGYVEDSFGEWWVEHWGHRSCRNFWHEHRLALANHG
ncbi:MAG: hypothetical protein M1818_004607 [Claussenomyces sp. TS43310]|nr:MAG: hypothetical protein M1818_004607 [Claussenomyces sp. TS43310]